jgi:TatD DNase family protein
VGGEGDEERRVERTAVGDRDGTAAGGPEWVDSHCHIPFGDPAGGDGGWAVTEAAVSEARAAGVTRLVSVATDLASSRAVLDVARRHHGVWATAGVHPHDAVQGVDGIEALLAEPEVVAVGECGLDHHYDHSPRDVQRTVFAAQVALARRHHLALVIHTREAWDDTFDVLAAEGVPDRTVFHCFTGGAAEARRALDLGATLSFSGILTFKTADDVREAAALCPLDRVLVETDSPYLAPVPHRGRPNRPAWVAVVGAALATVKGLDVDAVAAATTENARAAFRLGPG